MTDDAPGEFSDEERQQYEQEWEQISEKALQAQILMELQQIRVLLSAGGTNETVGGDTDAGANEYECDLCDWTGPEGDRERHATGQHRAPPGEWQGMFTERETQ